MVDSLSVTFRRSILGSDTRDTERYLTTKDEKCYDTNGPYVYGLSVLRYRYVNTSVNFEYSADVPPF